MHRLQAAEHFIHFFLSVAGRLSHHKIREKGVGTGFIQDMTVACLDKRAEISREIPLRGGDRLRASPAKPHLTEPRGIDELGGRILAEGPHHAPSLLLEPLHPEEAFLPDILKFQKIFRQFHAHSNAPPFCFSFQSKAECAFVKL